MTSEQEKALLRSAAMDSWLKIEQEIDRRATAIRLLWDHPDTDLREWIRQEGARMERWAADIRALRERDECYHGRHCRCFEHINEALNSGDGTYKP